MKVGILILAICLIFFGAMASHVAEAQETPIKVYVVTEKFSQNQPDNYVFGEEPVRVKITLANESGEEVIVPAGFSEKNFHLDLLFTFKKVKITAFESAKVYTPKTPPYASLVDEDGDGRREWFQGIERIPADWFTATEFFDAYLYYPLRPGAYVITGIVDTNIINPANVLIRFGKEVAAIPPRENDYSGFLSSTSAFVCIRGDLDGDGYSFPACDSGLPADCNDTDPAINPGAAEITGNDIDEDCNPDNDMPPDEDLALVKLLAQIHTIKDRSTKPPTSKEPAVDMAVRIFDYSEDSCVMTYGTSYKKYESIWINCADIGPAGRGRTDSEGREEFGLIEGAYFLMAEYRNPEGDKYYAGRELGVLEKGQVYEEYVQFLVTPDGNMASGRYKKVTGSELLIIEPEYIEWDSTEEQYPFVFESVGDWSVVTSISPPEGFEADRKAITTNVKAEPEAVQFTITDVGSSWTETKISHKVKHKGKVKTLKSKIGFKCERNFAKKKGFDKFCSKKK